MLIGFVNKDQFWLKNLNNLKKKHQIVPEKAMELLDWADDYPDTLPRFLQAVRKLEAENFSVQIEPTALWIKQNYVSICSTPLGTGEMGGIYPFWDQNRQAMVAVKILPLGKNFLSSNNIQEKAKLSQRLMKEARSLEKFKIVKNYDCGMGPGFDHQMSIYLITEFIPCEVLRQFTVINELKFQERQLQRKSLDGLFQEMISYMYHIAKACRHIEGETKKTSSPLQTEARPVSVKARDTAVLALSDVIIKSNSEMRAKALEMLDTMGATPSVIPGLIEALKDQNSYVCSTSAKILGKLGEAAKSAVPALVSVLQKSPSLISRCNAARALGSIEDQLHLAIPALVNASRDKDEKVRSVARQTLNELGIEKVVIPALTKTLAHSDAAIRCHAAMALGKMGACTEDTVSALAACLGDSDSYVRSSAAEVLGSFGVGAKSAVPALLQLLESEDWSVSFVVEKALEKIGADHLGEAASENPQSEIVAQDTRASRVTERELIQMSREQNPSLPKLAEALRDQDPKIRAKAAELLVQVGAQARAIQMDLIAALQDEDESVRANVRIVLKGIRKPFL